MYFDNKNTKTIFIFGKFRHDFDQKNAIALESFSN